MNQQMHIEDKYSRKNIRRYVADDIDIDSPVFNQCMQAIDHYMVRRYYTSKNKRIEELKATGLTLQEIVTELFITTLPIPEMSPIQSAAAQLGGRLGFKHLLDAVKTASEIIAVCEHTGLYTLYHAQDGENDTGTLGIRPNYKLSDDVIDFINMTMYLPPMLCKPKKWNTNADGGYLEGSGSILLGPINHHMKEQDLDSINIIQNIAWELNQHMLEIPEKPNKILDTDEKLQQFTQFAQESYSVYQQLLATGNEFYFTWKYDKRGRMYSQGYHVNLQSTQYKKAILQFKHKEVISL